MPKTEALQAPETTDERQLPALPWEGANKRTFLAAMRRGDLDGLLAAFYGPAATTIDEPTRHLAQYLMEVRRQNIAVLGDYDAFVRHTPTGDVHQVIKGVKLSLSDGTLYQIPVRVKIEEQTGEAWQPGKSKGRWDWVDRVKEPRRANVSHEGYLRMNAVAGCSLKQPASIMVDGEVRENPCVARGEHGDIERIVIGVNVAGPAPATGNVILVQYQLDMDPRKDLLSMLAQVAKSASYDDDTGEGGMGAVRLMHQRAYAEWVQGLKPDEAWRWHWLHLHGGVGYAHDLSRAKVADAYQKYINITDLVFRKAQTVARRNAMKAHPALAFHQVRVDERGETVIPIVGWAGGEGDLERYARALEDLASGRVDLGADVIEVVAAYEPEEVEEVHDPKPEDLDQPPGLTKEEEDRNNAMAILDDLVGMGDLSPDQVAALGYPPDADATQADLSAMIDRAHTMTSEDA